MHKISSVRHGWEKMTPSMGFGSQRQQAPQQPDVVGLSGPPTLPKPATQLPRPTAPKPNLSQSFNVPFSSTLSGPDPDDVIHATPGAFMRWTFAPGIEASSPVHKLPVHTGNVDRLRAMCKSMTDKSDGQIVASIISAVPAQIPGLQRGPLKALVTNVVLSGDPELVRRMRSRILNDTPIALKCTFVDVGADLIMDVGNNSIRVAVVEHIDFVAKWTGTDIFLLRPKQPDIETTSVNGVTDHALDGRLRISIFGDSESTEHAKTRILIMIDQVVSIGFDEKVCRPADKGPQLKRKVDLFKLELSMHSMICGRMRRYVKHIESSTNTAIYFPPPFPELFGYTPPGAHRRRADEIFITGERDQDIFRAKAKLHELVRTTQACVKEVCISPEKIDGMILERLDKIKRVIEYNGSYVLFPPLGIQRGAVRVQATDMLHVERTVRELMAISGQFYAASWWLTQDPTQRGPSQEALNKMLADICISSGADVSFENLTFQVYGSDDAVKAALFIISILPWVKKQQSHLKVKIELANEHKEFVSGKKNGKINKIMSQSHVNVYFDLFNEYNFFIDVSGASYEAAKNGLDLVEQEMPASIAFHVPDSYHKRIIGIGGQHIQRIMKKYSVFVKFSNAMDRGGSSRDDDDIKVDNVICRTPARNAQNLDLVKQEIMDMVEKSDAEFTSEQVFVNRLYHRELLARMPIIEDLEKKWNCKVTFPSTEEASDNVTITGPEYQVPHAVDELLGMVPEQHELTVNTNDELAQYFTTVAFQHEVVAKLKASYEIELLVHGLSSAAAAEEAAEMSKEGLTLLYTRNNAGGVKDAIDFLTTQLVAHGLDATTVRGAIPRPKSDSFEDSLPFFDSKLLHRSADAASITDSPTRSLYSEGGSERSFFDKIRKPGSMSSLSSFLDRRRNRNSNDYFKHASANASKVSLASLESTTSSYRNPWNDSGVYLTEEESSHNGGWPARFSSHSNASENKFPFAQPGASVSSLSLTSTPLPPPNHVANGSMDSKDRSSGDSARPGTSHSIASHTHGPIGGPITSPPSATNTTTTTK